MAQNFALRRRMYGDHLGTTNMALVGIATALGAAAKFPGSGGAAIGYAGVGAEGAARRRALKRAYERAGYVYVDLVPTANLRT